MKFSYKIDEVKTKNILNIAFDVSKDDLYMYTEYGSGQINCIQDQFSNRITTIESKLKALKALALQQGFNNIQVICEPTGGYERKLMHMARQLDCYTSYVNGESVSKSKVIENNDASKSDIKDPRVILLVAKYGKLMRDRQLPQEYNFLRQYNRMYDQEDNQKSYYKNLLHVEVRNLFCDFSFKNSFLFENSGRVLLKRFRCNPYRISKMGYSRFCRIMRKHAPRVRKITLQRIWDDARRSVKLIMPEEMIELLEKRINQLWENYLHHEQGLDRIKSSMCELYQKLLDKAEPLPKAQKGFVSMHHLARIVGETGPLSDFTHEAQLLRFSGLSLRIKQSGKYKGKNKISKKGRARLRLILGQSIFHLIKKDRIFGELYHRKKAEGMPGTKAMTVVSRKLLSILFALSKPGAVYDPARLFTCQNQYEKAA